LISKKEEGKNMTNAEWIKTLSDEELAIVITQFGHLYPSAVFGYNNSKLGVAIWLKEEHITDLHEYIKNGADYLRQMIERIKK
jgi:hypothetical protein